MHSMLSELIVIGVIVSVVAGFLIKSVYQITMKGKDRCFGCSTCNCNDIDRRK